MDRVGVVPRSAGDHNDVDLYRPPLEMYMSTIKLPQAGRARGVEETLGRIDFWRRLGGRGVKRHARRPRILRIDHSRSRFDRRGTRLLIVSAPAESERPMVAAVQLIATALRCRR